MCSNHETSVASKGISSLLLSLLIAVSLEGAGDENREKERTAQINSLLTDARYTKTTWKSWGNAESASKEPVYAGQPLSRLLRNKDSAPTNDITLDQMFTLKEIGTQSDSPLVTYQVPISYDAVKRIEYAQFSLLIDSNPEEMSRRREPRLSEWRRATNGDCLLLWNTAWSPVGKHAMQAALSLCDPSDFKSMLEVRGPVKPYYSSNLCQFFPQGSMFSDRGAYLQAAAAYSNVIFKIDIITPEGEPVKTISGKTTNGVIDADWNMIDENGHEYTNNSFIGAFHITVPDSGRSQTLKKHFTRMRTR